MTGSKEKLIILGSGPAGLTAAIYAARAGLKPVLVSGPAPGGQLTQTTTVENFPGFSNGILGTALMADMEREAHKFGTQFLSARITQVREESDGMFALETDEGEVLQTKALIVATGASPRRLEIPRERELTGYGVSTCATCDGAFYSGQSVAVVGGGDSAIEEVTYLSNIARDVVLVHRGSTLRASYALQERLKKFTNIRVVLDTTVSSIEGSNETGVTGVVLKRTDGKEQRLPVSALFVAIGHSPATSLFKGWIKLDPDGFIETGAHSTATSRPGVFAAGDVQDRMFRQAITAAGTGAMAAIEAERWLQSKKIDPVETLSH